MKLRPLLRQVQQLPRWLVSAMAAALCLLVGLGGLAYFNIERQVRATRWVEHTYKVVESLRGVLSAAQEADNSQRSYVVSGTESYRQAYLSAERLLPGLVTDTDELIADNPMQRVRLRKVRQSLDERLALARERIAQRQALGVDALGPKFITPASALLMESIRTDINTMTGAENRLLEDRLRILEHARVRGLVFQTIGGVLSIGLLLVVFAGLARQILRANRAESETQRSNAQLKDANNELRAFSYSVAHDLRAPLRAINGFAQVIVEDCQEQLNDDGRRALGRITSNAKTMGLLIDDLLMLSKVSYQSLRTEKVEMTALVREAYQELLDGQDGRLIECEISELPPAVGDASLLRQVWLNLIGNALKFTRQRDRTHIEIGGNVAGPEFATYFIRDNGAGFDMQYVSKLFGAFQRLHRPADFEGTGIGLALVQRIVHRHGGAIWAEGKENEGARFAFTLPEWAEKA